MIVCVCVCVGGGGYKGNVDVSAKVENPFTIRNS